MARQKKRSYTSYLDALIALTSCDLQERKGNSNRLESRIYQEGKRFHLTSLKED